MRRLLALIIALTALVVGLQTSPAMAANPTTYFVDEPNGSAVGGVVWSNRSVTVQGSVKDYKAAPSAYTQVRFNFFLKNGTTPYATQTRTALFGEEVPYNFVQEGPAGGIWHVNVHVCTSPPAMSCSGRDADLFRG
jgi:hypothetical protein